MHVPPKSLSPNTDPEDNEGNFRVQSCWINWLVYDSAVLGYPGRINSGSRKGGGAVRLCKDGRIARTGIARTAQEGLSYLYKQRFGRTICATTETFIHSICAYSFGYLLYEGSNTN